MTKLVLLRHGESQWNLDNRFTGWTDVDLTPKGVEEAHESARLLREAGFAPDVQAEIDKLMAADFLILQFPFWWYSVPAMLKGWIDRVFAYGVAYDFGRTWDRGVFRGRSAMLAFTTSAPPTSSFPDGRNGDLDQPAALASGLTGNETISMRQTSVGLAWSMKF